LVESGARILKEKARRRTRFSYREQRFPFG
jgi:hypothetical protein